VVIVFIVISGWSSQISNEIDFIQSLLKMQTRLKLNGDSMPSEQFNELCDLVLIVAFVVPSVIGCSNGLDDQLIYNSVCLILLLLLFSN
jgi:hypothetical protein